MQKINIPYGYKTFMLGNVSVYTGKLRIKQDLVDVLDYISGLTLDHSILAYEGKRGCTIVTWSTTDAMVAGNNIRAMKSFLAGVMHARISHKYGELVETEPDFGW